MRCGRFPRRDFLKKYDMEHFRGLSEAVSSGNVRQFDEEFLKHEDLWIKYGTILVIEKLKLLAFTNLVKNVYAILSKELERKGSTLYKHNLIEYQNALYWQNDCDDDEAVCILSNLIYIGAVRGYMSDEHNKIVFSKENPFPPASAWCPKQ